MSSSYDDDDAMNEPRDVTPSLGDVITRWRYTLTPTLYVDESSDVSELLWQQVLEQRAIRAWLVVLVTVLVLVLLVGTFLLLTFT